MTLTETAYAKINLALHVRRRRDDGYHDIETLFAFADFGDVLDAAPSKDVGLTVEGPFAAAVGAAGDNLVLRAAARLTRPGKGAALRLDKRLPVAAGLGGGSADAAATLRLLNRMWALGHDPRALASIGGALGADVAACVDSETARGEGTGNRLRPLGAALAGTPVLLVNPRRLLATGPVFAAWDGEDRGALAHGSALDAAIAGRNDLEPAAIGLCPEIAEVLTHLRGQDGPVLVRMSGSGATCFALFADEAGARSAEAATRTRHPQWWSARGKLR